MIAFAFYLLKLIACSGILFLYYHIALRNKIFHQWNRFYLLAAIVLSIAIPFLQVTITKHTAETSSNAVQLLRVVQSANGYLEEVTVSSHKPVSSNEWVLLSYLTVSVFLLLSFLRSLTRIFSIIRSHAVTVISNIKFINTKVEGTPFSFFHFIFWNEEINLQSETGQQIFEHELVHVQEKHTLDKLFVQLTLIFFWCNPFFWLIRKELKLIHEFIADKKATAQHGTAAFAAMILQATYPQQFNSITNQFFQTSIKRRLAMLTKIQNPRFNYLSRLLILPVLAFIVFAFGVKTKNISSPVIPLEKKITVVIDAGHGLDKGHYNGSRSGDVYEDNVTLSIAKKIQELNANNNINIVLTRSTENDVDLKKRVAIAQENNADLFISIHVNAMPPVHHTDGTFVENSQSTGFEVVVPGKNIVYQKQSEVLASTMVSELNNLYKTDKQIQTKQVPIYVLNNSPCPSVLIECGYLTNPQDKKFIINEENQKAVAQKILLAIEKYEVLKENSGTKSLSDTMPVREFTVTANFNGVFGADVTSANKPLLIVNGQKVKPEYLSNKKIIGSGKAFGKNDPKAIKLYGNEAKNGVLIFENATIEEAQNTNSDTMPRKPLYIVVNGKEFLGNLNDINVNNIESITVLKDDAATKKYGDKGRNGVIEIIMKTKIKDTLPITTNLHDSDVTFKRISLDEAKKINSLIVIDGKPFNGKIDKLPITQNQIKSIAFAKGLGIINELGEKARNGVILITTKDYAENNLSESDNQIFQKTEVEASIDKQEWRKFLSENLQPFIENAASKGAAPGSYTVNVKFIVKKDGSLTEIKTLNDPGFDLAKNVLTMMNKSPKWKPAEQNGRLVNSYHTQPITFVISEQ